MARKETEIASSQVHFWMSIEIIAHFELLVSFSHFFLQHVFLHAHKNTVHDFKYIFILTLPGLPYICVFICVS